MLDFCKFAVKSVNISMEIWLLSISKWFICHCFILSVGWRFKHYKDVTDRLLFFFVYEYCREDWTDSADRGLDSGDWREGGEAPPHCGRHSWIWRCHQQSRLVSGCVYVWLDWCLKFCYHVLVKALLHYTTLQLAHSLNRLTNTVQCTQIDLLTYSVKDHFEVVLNLKWICSLWKLHHKLHLHHCFLCGLALSSQPNTLFFLSSFCLCTVFLLFYFFYTLDHNCSCTNQCQSLFF